MPYSYQLISMEFDPTLELVAGRWENSTDEGCFDGCQCFFLFRYRKSYFLSSVSFLLYSSSFYTPVHPSIYPPIRFSVRLSVHPFIRPFLHSFIRSSVHPFTRSSFIRSSVHPLICASVHPFIRFLPSVSPSVRPTIRPSIHPSIPPSVRLSIRPLVWLSCSSGL